MNNNVGTLSIRQRYENIVQRIAASARAAGRNPEEVQVVVVTKLQPLEAIREVIDSGARNLGENYADEALTKIDALRNLGDIHWHMIGHVQSRKARIVALEFHYLHSLDSLKLAEKLDRLSAEEGRKLPVLLEFNVSGEESKTGFAVWKPDGWQQLLPTIERILALPNLEVRGLMTMPPFFDQPEKARPFFKRLREFQSILRTTFPQNDWYELSMGMSGDFEVAIQEGATWVRIGTSILGPRQVPGVVKQ